MQEDKLDGISIFKRGDLEIFVKHQPTEEGLRLLNNMTVGSKGAQYLHKDIDERMEQLDNKYVLYMTKGNKILATYTAGQRTVHEDFGDVNAYYIRYFAFAERFQSSKNITEKRTRSNGLLKKMVKNLLAESPANMGIDHGEDSSLPSFYYAFFDSENFRSTNLSQVLGLYPVGEFDTFSFTRMYPKKNKHVELLDPVHHASMRDRLRQFFSGYSVYTDQFLFIKDYFVWRENGEVVAGVQPNKCQWEVKHMSGINGIFMLNVLPYLPWVRNFFNPKDFQFITFDFVYVKPGYEDKLELLMESMLAEHEVTFSLIWQDVKGPLHQILSAMNLGFLNKFSKIPTGKIMMTTNRISPEQLDNMTSKPMFTCAMDMT